MRKVCWRFLATPCCSWRTRNPPGIFRMPSCLLYCPGLGMQVSGPRTNEIAEGSVPREGPFLLFSEDSLPDSRPDFSWTPSLAGPHNLLRNFPWECPRQFPRACLRIFPRARRPSPISWKWSERLQTCMQGLRESLCQNPQDSSPEFPRLLKNEGELMGFSPRWGSRTTVVFF